MDRLILNEKNNIYTRIKDIENLLSRCQKTIDRLKSQDNTEFNRKQISKNEKSIIDYNHELEELRERINKLTSGLLDEELKNVSFENQKVCNQQQIVTAKKIKDKNEKKKQDKIYLDIDYNNFKKKEGANNNSLQKETYYFFKNCESMPEYMIANLKDMPNNK